MRKIAPFAILGSLLSLFSMDVSANTEAPVIQYISQYKTIAISEMHRTGIPASITLAQGIVESRYGTSTLSTASNNHFGIKCKKDWKGKTYYFKDDDYQNGKLVKSCFRGYADPVQSYYDHSDFLLENPRYQPLFRLKRTDYRGWAKGLKSCGYATARDYAKTLIRTIEKYKLNRYDQLQAMPNEPMVDIPAPVTKIKFVSYTKPTQARPNEPIVEVSEPIKKIKFVSYSKPTYKPAISPPKAVALPENYRRGTGARMSSASKPNSFREEVFRGEGPYLFEIVPSVTRKSVER